MMTEPKGLLGCLPLINVSSLPVVCHACEGEEEP